MPLFVNVINHNSVNVLRSIGVEVVLLTFIAEFDEFIFLKHEPICLCIFPTLICNFTQYFYNIGKYTSTLTLV